MARRNLWLSGLCLLALGAAGMAGVGGPAGGAAAVVDREAEQIWGGQYCTARNVSTSNACIQSTSCITTTCYVLDGSSGSVNVRSNPACGGNTACGPVLVGCN